MLGDDYSGGAELSPEDLDSYEEKYEEVLLELHQRAEESEQAREFLATPLGRALRRALVHEKLEAMRELAENAMNANFMEYKHHYDVICGVERIFALIITDGEQAIEQLQLKVTEDE